MGVSSTGDGVTPMYFYAVNSLNSTILIKLWMSKSAERVARRLGDVMIAMANVLQKAYNVEQGYGEGEQKNEDRNEEAM